MHCYEGHVINCMKPTKTMHLEIHQNYCTFASSLIPPKMGPMTHIPLEIHEDIPRADDCSNPKSWRVNLYQILDLANMYHVFIYLAQKSCEFHMC